MLEDAIKRYHNGMIDTVEFLEKVLIPFAAQIKESDRKGEKLDLISENMLSTQHWK